MKFLIDAQLPPSLKQIFISRGYDCIHTSDLKDGNETKDEMVNKISIDQTRILITKDSDFFYSFVIKKTPFKLIFVKLGNASRRELLNFFDRNFEEIILKITGENMIFLRKE